MSAVTSLTFLDKFGVSRTAYRSGDGYMVSGRMATTRASAVKLLAKYVNSSDAESILDRL